MMRYIQLIINIAKYYHTSLIILVFFSWLVAGKREWSPFIVFKQYIQIVSLLAHLVSNLQVHILSLLSMC